MKSTNKAPILAVLAVSCALGLVAPITVFAATTPSLGAATTYGVLSNTYTNTVAGTTINGDVGFTTPPAVVPAGIHTNYGSAAPYATAGIDQGNALTTLAAEPCTFTFAPGAIDLSTDITHGPVGVYLPGVYCSTGAMNIGGPLTLSGTGTFIFRPDGALTSTAGAVVTLASASACDVFWTPSSATTLGANTTFAGTLIGDAGATLGANTTWLGRSLAFGGTVTTDTNTITVPTCTGTLHIVKAVVNDDGGVGVAADATVHLKAGVVDVPGSPQAGAGLLGTPYVLTPGSYVVSEDALAGYNATFTGSCDIAGNVTIAAGDDITCTITNNDIPPVLPATINVVKIVVNDNGGVKGIGDFPLFVNATPVVSGITNVFPAPAVYAVTETADPGYTQAFSGDCDIAGNITLSPGDIKVCVITNNDIAPVVPPPSGGGGGGSSSGGSTPVPPLIDVVKVPNPLALPGGPGPVTYTYTLRNIGTIAVGNITMVGDTCSPITLVSGDTNADNRLDVSETWVYTCTTTLTETHTNTVVATGHANGISTSDIASATVIVGAPVVPPLIHVTKVPSPLALPVGGGSVTYTEKITNLTTVPLENVTLDDDKCAPMKFISGDTNGDSNLDITETWTYTCTANLAVTTTNTAIASGQANGITVRDFAIATVVVPVAVVVAAPLPVAEVVTTVIPGLPNTGFVPSENIPLSAAAILALSSLLYILRRKKSL